MICFLKLDIFTYISKIYLHLESKKPYEMPIISLTISVIEIRELKPPQEKKSKGKPWFKERIF